ncbi:hypothetical protein [Amycolatopsis lexingtonensis]|uniref:hypothetical protein n=1 Tax=Amycolatopsis lexingtonensis TaxID=218822 RepID=UPI003F6E5CDB
MPVLVCVAQFLTVTSITLVTVVLQQVTRDPGLGCRLAGHAAAWTRSNQEVLVRFLGAADAARLDALFEGMIMCALPAAGPRSRKAARAAITKAVDLPGMDGFGERKKKTCPIGPCSRSPRPERPGSSQGPR